jgi:hypothetical protein
VASTAEATPRAIAAAQTFTRHPRLIMRTPTTAQVRTAIEVLKKLEERIDNHATFNTMQLPETRGGDDTALFESSEVRAQLKEKLGGREIAMSRMQDWLVEALNAQNLTITAAVKHPGFSLLDRQRLQTWQRKLYTEIESVAGLLLPTK